jgi:uncharacterized protein
VEPAGSQVLRGQMLVLPVDDTFVYIEPIYLQAAEARMPQLKKVVIAVGNRLIYEDTYEQALSALAGQEFLDAAPPPQTAPAVAAAATETPVPSAAQPASEALNRLRNQHSSVKDQSASCKARASTPRRAARWSQAGTDGNRDQDGGGGAQQRRTAAGGR